MWRYLRENTVVRIDLIFRNIRGSNKPFGGCHVLVVGDFFQLPPIVKGHSLYVNLQNYSNPTNEDVEGYKLWNMFKYVVILTENNRKLDDNE